MLLKKNQDNPRPLPPAVISIGAPHTRPAKPLPQVNNKFSFINY